MITLTVRIQTLHLLQNPTGMKNKFPAQFHFSSYPPHAVNAGGKKTQSIQKNPPVHKQELRPPVRKESIANNPKNWDVSWFCNYE